MIESIQNPCISVHLSSQHLTELQNELQATLKRHGVDAECADSSLHVSIAYASGEAGFVEVAEVVGEIQKLDAETAFRARAGGFTLLPGVSTPFDYLSIEIESTEWLKSAAAIAERRLNVRRFPGGFKSHISLLRIPKGAWNAAIASRLVREINASIRAACALGQAPCWGGECVAVSGQSRQVCYKKPLRAA